MEQPFNLRFENVFKISYVALRLNGSHPHITWDRLWKFPFPFYLFFILNSMFVFYCLSYSVLFHDIISGNYTDASKNCTMIIVFLTITLKYISLVKHQESVKSMINYVQNDYSDNKNYTSEDKDTMLKYANAGVNVCKFWFVAAAGTTVIFPLKALVTMAYYHWHNEFKLVPMFELTYPEPIERHKNVPIIFVLLFIVTVSFGMYATSIYVGFDPLVPIFMLHVCGQLVLLSRRLSRLFSEVENNEDIKRELKKIILRLQSIYQFVSHLQLNFSLLYEYNLKATTFMLPFTAFQIIEDLRNHWINLEFICFFCSGILHFFLPSYYSDLLMEKGEDFREAIYSSGWEKCPDKEVRQIILFMITRARIPMGIRTIFYEINLDTFAEMCRQSYALLNLMNAAWSK